MTWGVFCKACLHTFEVEALVRVVRVNGKEALMHESCATKLAQEAARETFQKNAN